MKCKEICSYLEKKYPLSCAEDWDNVGLQVGSGEKEVKKVFLTLDLTEETLEEACVFGADLIVSHHPMIFKGTKKITDQSFLGRKIIRLIQSDISYYAMHTNYDICGMAEESGRRLHLLHPQVLAVTGEKDDRQEGFGRVGDLEEPMTLREYALAIKEWYGIPDVKVYGDLNAVITRAAICTGSGKSFLKEAMAAGADVYVTGDIDHHTGIDAVADGLSIIDAGHYGTEYIFAEDLQKVLKEAFEELEIRCARVKSPYAIL